MAVNPINVGRISQSMRFDATLINLQQGQLQSFIAQNKIATGRNFVSLGEDPVAATRALDLRRVLAQQGQLSQNLGHASNILDTADATISEINTLITEAHTIALQNINSTASAAERESEAELILGIRNQLMMVGNRQMDGRFIFAGRETMTAPFTDALGGVAYLGDTGDLLVRSDVGQTEIVNVPGNVLFGALSSQIASSVDLTPAVSADTRLSDVGGISLTQLRAGRLVISEQGGDSFSVDLSNVDTVGDVADAITAAATAAGSTLSATVTTMGLEIDPGAAVRITDTGTGQIAASLGILVTTETSSTITGVELTPRISRLTLVSDLARGGGIDLESGLAITNGPESVTIDLSQAETVQDLVNLINNAGSYTLARINDQGTAIDLFNQVSGTALTVGENGGTTAADLGLRTLEQATPLARLNNGAGVTLAEGEDDLEISTSDGESFTVNLDGAETIGDVIESINTAATEAGVSITASFATTGNGIRLEDASRGDEALTVRNAGLSQAAAGLGLTDPALAEDGELVGADVNPTRTEGVFDALVELENALRNDDTAAISRAAESLDGLILETTRTQGVVGARAQNARDQVEQMQLAANSTETLLSEVEDLNYAEAVTELTSAQTQLQATLQTATAVLNLSLFDFLS